MPLSGFSVTPFEHAGASRDVYRRGTGPGVVVMHETPGITPKVAAFGRRLADAGFTVVMPSLFGTPGRSPRPGYLFGQLSRACVGREFSVLAKRKSSPITTWLRALCRALHAELGGPGVGALGMCLTGNFALSLMVDEAVMAPVLSQPSLPFPVSPWHCRALAISDRELAIVKERVTGGVKVLGLRFSHDTMSPQARFSRLRQELGDGFEAIEIDSSPGNLHGHRNLAHSVLTEDLLDTEGQPTLQALERVIAFFHERLGA
jgi:dienelactone hydrolase